MSKRTPFVLVGLLAFLSFVNLALAGTVQVTIIKASDGKLTCVDKSGNEHTIPVAADAKITCDCKACKLEELQKDQKAIVTGMRVNCEKVITAIEARSK